MSTYNPLGLALGDTVRIKPYRTQTMSGYWYEGWGSGVVGVLVRMRMDYDWRAAPNLGSVRFLSDDDDFDASERERPLSELELVAKGDGTVVPGVTYPFSGYELRQQRLAQLVARIVALNRTHQGYSNPATFLAALYLGNDRRARERLPHMQRKDGTINPEKVRKLFFEVGLKVDDWAFEPTLDIPREFAGWRLGTEVLYAVDWSEVAADFAAERKAA